MLYLKLKLIKIIQLKSFIGSKRNAFTIFCKHVQRLWCAMSDHLKNLSTFLDLFTIFLFFWIYSVWKNSISIEIYSIFRKNPFLKAWEQYFQTLVDWKIFFHKNIERFKKKITTYKLVAYLDLSFQWGLRYRKISEQES